MEKTTTNPKTGLVKFLNVSNNEKEAKQSNDKTLLYIAIIGPILALILSNALWVLILKRRKK